MTPLTPTSVHVCIGSPHEIHLEFSRGLEPFCTLRVEILIVSHRKSFRRTASAMKSRRAGDLQHGSQGAYADECARVLLTLTSVYIVCIADSNGCTCRVLTASSAFNASDHVHLSTKKSHLFNHQTYRMLTLTGVYIVHC